jgi:hypothetical protein
MDHRKAEYAHPWVNASLMSRRRFALPDAARKLAHGPLRLLLNRTAMHQVQA